MDYNIIMNCKDTANCSDDLGSLIKGWYFHNKRNKALDILIKKYCSNNSISFKEEIFRAKESLASFSFTMNNCIFNNGEISSYYIFRRRSSLDYYCSILHEIIHTTGVFLGRERFVIDNISKGKDSEVFQNQMFAREEAVAEMGAMKLISKYYVGYDYNQGMTYIKNNIIYGGLFEKRSDVVEFANIESDKAIRYIYESSNVPMIVL